MLDSIYIGMSGMTAYAKGLQTISNNVANLNTPGFKTSTPRFADLYYGRAFTEGRSDANDTTSFGSGVHYGYASLNFAQGDLHASDGQLDLAIQGEGFLTLLDHGVTRYVRTAQFAIGDDGLATDKASGLTLAALTASGALAPVSLAGKQTHPPVATTTITFADNLSAGVQSVDPQTATVYDAQGQAHALTINFAPDDSLFQGRWAITVKDDQGTTLHQDTLQFLGGVPESGLDTFDFTLDPDAATPSHITVDFSAITNYSMGSQSTLRVAKTDGAPAGTLTSLAIDADGKLVLSYSNGQTTTADTIAVATFTDPQRLQPLGNGLWDASHLPSPRYHAGTGDGAGRLVAGSTEASNVDLSAEFGSLILIQRGFQASSQVVTTANEMIMQLFQMRGQG